MIAPEDIEPERKVVGEQADVEGRVLLGGEGVHVPTDLVDRLGDLGRVPGRRALEQQMLKEMRRAGVSGVVSSRDPVPTQTPIVADRASAIRSVTRRAPHPSTSVADQWAFDRGGCSTVRPQSDAVDQHASRLTATRRRGPSLPRSPSRRLPRQPVAATDRRARPRSPSSLASSASNPASKDATGPELSSRRLDLRDGPDTRERLTPALELEALDPLPVARRVTERATGRPCPEGRCRRP